MSIRWITNPLWDSFEPLANAVDLPTKYVVAFTAACVAGLIGLAMKKMLKELFYGLPVLVVSGLRSVIGIYALTAIADFKTTTEWTPFGIELMTATAGDTQRFYAAAVVTILLIASYWAFGLDRIGFSAETKMESYKGKRRENEAINASANVQRFRPQPRYRTMLNSARRGIRLGNQRYRGIGDSTDDGLTTADKDDIWRDATGTDDDRP